MLNDYLIVNKEVLPEIFPKVIEVKELMENGSCLQVSEAVKQVGISRSAYYKYKDHVHSINKSDFGRKAVISFSLSHQKGILSEVLNVLMSCKCNVITINQNIPIRNQAKVMISLDVSELEITIEQLITEISKISGVSKCSLIAVE